MRLAESLRANEVLWECLYRFPALNLPAWYLGAGCVAQTIWNLAHDKVPGADILDYDLVYYDRDVSEARELDVSQAARALVADLAIELDVTNEARVHLGIPSGSATASSPINRPRTPLAHGRRPRRPSGYARAVVSLRCGHRLVRTICSTLSCGRTAYKSRRRFVRQRWLVGRPDGPLWLRLGGKRASATQVYAAWTFPSGHDAVNRRRTV